VDDSKGGEIDGGWPAARGSEDRDNHVGRCKLTLQVTVIGSNSYGYRVNSVRIPGQMEAGAD